MADEQMDTAGEGQAPKKGKKKLILLLVLLLVVGGGGAAAWQMGLVDQLLGGGGDQAAEDGAAAEQEQAQAEESTGAESLVTLPTFIVNLADPLGRRYLKLGMDVEVRNAESADELTAREAKVRDSVILLLSSKSYQDLATIESKILLKKEIAERLNQVLGGPKVQRVYITEMVVQ